MEDTPPPATAKASRPLPEDDKVNEDDDGDGATAKARKIHQFPCWSPEDNDGCVCPNDGPDYVCGDACAMMRMDWACTEGRPDAVRYLMDKGVSANIPVIVR